jgi:hypothetical protein
MQKQRLMPISWFWFALFPFLGQYIYEKLDNLLSRPFEFKLTPKRRSISNLILFEDTRWVLFQEQYDRKTSAHHGTKVRFLASNSHFEIIASASNGPKHDPNKIFIEVARKKSEDVKWGALNYQAPNWKLSNHKIDVVIPIIASDSNALEICRPAQAKILFGKEKFVVGLSEFNLLLLPKPYVVLSEGGRLSYYLLSEESLVCGLSNTKLIIQDPNIKNPHWEIKNRIMTVYQTIEYTKVVSGLPIIQKQGDLVISAGDKFRIPDTEFRFWIDYQKI